jgi:drug/metabolite transporter (DMT)-like permease
VSMAPATCLGQVFVAAAFLPFVDPGQIGGEDVLVLGFLGGGQIGLGLVLLTIGARLIPAAQVGLITLLEVVLGPLWVWLALGERPDTATLIGGAIVVAAIVYQTRDNGDEEGRSLFRKRSGRAPVPGRRAGRRRSG